MPQPECGKLNKCVFISGNTRKYCRLQHRYTMDADCNIIDKAKTRKKKNSTSPPPQAPQAPSASKKAKAKEIIHRFMNRTKHKRKAEFLKALCNDAGVCIAFGTFAAEIKKHFNGFIHFDYAVDPVKMIGEPSQNGFINEIKYDHRGYQAYAILKSSQEPNADNLFYEYIVGHYVNKLNKRFPCFLETYGYYTYKAEADWQAMQRTVIKPAANLKKGLTFHKNDNYALACSESKYLALLIQHLKGIRSIKAMMYDNAFLQNDLLQVLFQIYLPLHLCQDTFTHYDLHYENANLYQPTKNGYLHFHYHFNNEVISFKSKYVAKIIDYGRSYFKDGPIESKNIYNNVCKEKNCKPACGYDKGFSWLGNAKLNRYNYWISSRKNNKSHDLRLLNELKINYNLPQLKQVREPLFTLLSHLKYNVNYGTPEATPGFPYAIRTVEDAAKLLLAFITRPEEISNNDAAYAHKTKFGDLHIYDDGKPMLFIKS
jgi:hypothetical protein